MESPLDRKLRIVLLDSDAKVRDTILLPGLAEHGFSVTGVATALALYEHLRTDTPDIVVLDPIVPDADGFSMGQAVRGLFPHIGIIILGDQMDTVGLSQWADACLVKPVHLGLLAANVRSLARRLRRQARTTPSLRWRFDADDWKLISPNGRSAALSRNEQRVMGVLASTPGQLVTREHLVAAVTDDARNYDPHRIESLIHRLRRKVASQCGEPLPLSAIPGRGYVLNDAHQDLIF